MEWAESSSEPMKSRLFIDYIIKTISVFEKRGSFEGYFVCLLVAQMIFYGSVKQQVMVTNIILIV